MEFFGASALQKVRPPKCLQHLPPPKVSPISGTYRETNAKMGAKWRIMSMHPRVRFLFLECEYNSETFMSQVVCRTLHIDHCLGTLHRLNCVIGAPRVQLEQFLGFTY